MDAPVCPFWARRKRKMGKKIKLEEKMSQNKKEEKKNWQKPTLEDVSGKIMAQPYIRFT